MLLLLHATCERLPIKPKIEFLHGLVSAVGTIPEKRLLYYCLFFFFHYTYICDGQPTTKQTQTPQQTEWKIQTFILLIKY